VSKVSTITLNRAKSAIIKCQPSHLTVRTALL
jgi:hypothetical protein